ncbi:TPA: adhesin, partial [Haemophilus influenzae]
LIHFATRLANAITTLFSDPELAISEEGALKMISLQRWLTLIFASSPYVNADHILNKYNINPDSEGGFHLATDNSSIAKFCIFYLPESNINMSLDALWAGNQQLCASLCFALQSSRFIGTASAFHKRAVVLQWFPKKLAEIADLNELPANILHDVYMHCSYDLAKNKHDVKRPLNELVRKHILTQGWQDRYLYTLGKKDG